MLKRCWLGYKIHSLWREVLEEWKGGKELVARLFMYVLIYILCIYVCICSLLREKACILEDVHFIISAFPAPVVHLCKIPYFADYYRN